MHDIQANKQHAMAFYRTTYLGDPPQAVEQYVGDEYIKIVEHRDAIQEVPETTKKGNPPQPNSSQAVLPWPLWRPHQG